MLRHRGRRQRRFKLSIDKHNLIHGAVQENLDGCAGDVVRVFITGLIGKAKQRLGNIIPAAAEKFLGLTPYRNQSVIVAVHQFHLRVFQHIGIVRASQALIGAYYNVAGTLNRSLLQQRHAFGIDMPQNAAVAYRVLQKLFNLFGKRLGGNSAFLRLTQPRGRYHLHGFGYLPDIGNGSHMPMYFAWVWHKSITSLHWKQRSA